MPESEPDRSGTFNPFGQYAGKGPESRQRFVRWFHNRRLADFASYVDPGPRLLSVGCGTAELESKLLMDSFEAITTLEVSASRAKTAQKKGLDSVHGSAPPMPFADDSFDAIVSAGTIEHLPDEHGFLKEATRCLTPDGSLYLTVPIEVGVGGLLRFWGKNFVHPDREDSPDGIRRYADYSSEELFKSVPRDKHGTSHRYYNYTYLLEDLREWFEAVTVRGWPLRWFGTLNLVLFVRADSPGSR